MYTVSAKMLGYLVAIAGDVDAEVAPQDQFDYNAGYTLGVADLKDKTPKPQPYAPQVNAAKVREIKNALMHQFVDHGGKIEAIKALRAATGLDLKESKDIVEEFYTNCVKLRLGV